MGRPRKPTSLKILDGDRPDRIPAAEPAAAAGLGDAPPWLDPIGKLTWSRMAELLGPLEVATRSDREALTLYCVAYSVWHRAMATVEAEGLTVETRTSVKPHPCLAVANEAQRQLNRTLSRFGLTPSDRAGLHVRAEPERDDLLDFLQRPSPPDAKPSRGRPPGRRKVDPKP